MITFKVKQLSVVSLFFFSLFLLDCSSNHSEIERYSIRIPGEFEDQEAIWLGFRTNETEAFDSISLEIVKALNPYIQLRLIVEHDSLLRQGKALFDQIGLDTSKIELFYQTPTDGWFRDPGPIFGLTSENKLAIADFKYTNYKNIHPNSIDSVAIAKEGIDRDIANRLGLPLIKSIVTMEGGSFETNGKGILIQCEDVTLNRNPHLSKKEIEKDFSTNFNMSKVIWLPTGIAEDPLKFEQIHGNYFGIGAGGHTDEFVRFANDSTILLSWVEEEEVNNHIIHSLNYEVLTKNFEILKESRNENGRPFKIIKIPHPEPIVREFILNSDALNSTMGEKYSKEFGFEVNDTIKLVAASSYLNFLISNEVVIIPKYWKEGESQIVNEKDIRVKAIFTTMYPDKEIIAINPAILNWNGGGIHCRYQSEPKT